MDKKTQQLIEIKKPDLRYPILKAMESRFSPRVFAEGGVAEKDLNTMFEAVRWAPSARNDQPWYFYWTKIETASHKKLASCLPSYNEWTAKAPVLILACYINEGDNEYALYDLGAAVVTLVYQATALGYCARQVGSFDRKKAKEVLSLPSNQHPFVLIPLGKLGNYSQTSESIVKMDFQKRERKTDLAKESK